MSDVVVETLEDGTVVARCDQWVSEKGVQRLVRTEVRQSFVDSPGPMELERAGFDGLDRGRLRVQIAGAARMPAEVAARRLFDANLAAPVRVS